MGFLKTKTRDKRDTTRLIQKIKKVTTPSDDKYIKTKTIKMPNGPIVAGEVTFNNISKASKLTAETEDKITLYIYGLNYNIFYLKKVETSPSDRINV